MQIAFAGSYIIAKSALNKGMNHYALAIYRNLFSAVTFAPFAVVLERKVRPRMTISVLLKKLFLGLLEPVIDQNLFYAAMKYTTATLATAMTNMLPAITFLLAWILSVFGSIIIVLGLYLVIWGKSNDNNLSSKTDTSIDQIGPTDQHTPEKILTTESSNDEKNDANIAGVDAD
ncbi:hypothetical protein ACH5RR_019199 [Cinchona calisaya]|uniref:WAT1-related protein n=1 Tax=Cinchona calisaya TaxID=153742 RepID=A0ABD2ZRT6_9GENT